MKYLLDTNILLRLVEPEHELHKETVEAILTLRAQDSIFVILLQNISEFWNVCTRPKENNGLGFGIVETNEHLRRLERFFAVVPDTLQVYRYWRELVVRHSVSGVKVHDAKIVAAMKAHTIDNLLTFNTSDFKRYDEITAISPHDL